MFIQIPKSKQPFAAQRRQGGGGGGGGGGSGGGGHGPGGPRRPIGRLQPTTCVPGNSML